MGASPPTRRNSFCSSTRRSLVWMAGGISPISSRKMVPWWASSKSPRRESMAPVKAPFSWPKSSLSSTVGESAATFTAMKALCRRGESACTPRAKSSLPVPDSPVISTVESTGAICTTRSSASRMASVSPTIPVSRWRRRRSRRVWAMRSTSSGSTEGAKVSARPRAASSRARPGAATPKTGMCSRSRACVARSPADVARASVRTSSTPAPGSSSSRGVTSSTR